MEFVRLVRVNFEFIVRLFVTSANLETCKFLFGHVIAIITSLLIILLHFSISTSSQISALRGAIFQYFQLARYCLYQFYSKQPMN